METAFFFRKEGCSGAAVSAGLVPNAEKKITSKMQAKKAQLEIRFPFFGTLS